MPSKRAKKTPDDLRRIVGNGPARTHIEQLIGERDGEDAARTAARQQAEATPRYPWQTDADRAALIALAEQRAVAMERIKQLPGVRAMRTEAQHGRQARADRRKGGLSRRRADPAQIAKLADRWRKSDNLQETYRTENAYIHAKTGLSFRTIRRAKGGQS